MWGQGFKGQDPPQKGPHNLQPGVYLRRDKQLIN